MSMRVLGGLSRRINKSFGRCGVCGLLCLVIACSVIYANMKASFLTNCACNSEESMRSLSDNATEKQNFMKDVSLRGQKSNMEASDSGQKSKVEASDNEHKSKMSASINEQKSKMAAMNASYPIENLKKILLWSPWYWSKTYFMKSLGQQPFYDVSCPVTNCFITGDRNQQKDAAVVVFPGVKTKSKLPGMRYGNQLYALITIESPGYSFNHYVNIDDTMNVTISYRRDSDVYLPYFFTNKLEQPAKEPYKLRYNLNERDKYVVWFVSNCNTPIKREQYANKLSKHIDLTIIGNCGNRTVCPRKEKATCMQKVAARYKFVLSFENTFCVDYVTEKAYTPLEYDMIPIVFGGANYTAHMPPHSFINILDYKSAGDLATYLHYLANNDTAYMEYFHWHDNYEVGRPGTEPAFCDLCQLLNREHYTKYYPNYNAWWETGKCTNNILQVKHL